MTRINLVKYGFTRFPEYDFSDDGNRFTCYRFSESDSHVSKLVSDGEAYLSAHVEGQLPYDVYSKLPNYNAATWSFNGISLSSLTDEMLQDFFNACVNYEKEYRAAEAAIEYPSLEEIIDKASRITNHRMLELSKIENRLNRNMREAITKFSTYEWKQLHEYFNNLVKATHSFDIATYPQTIVGQAFSFTFVKPTYEMGVSYWFQSLNELFDKYNLD